MFSDFKRNVNFRIKNGKQGYSTAFEFLDEIEKVFLSDIGDNNKFGPSMVDCKDDIQILNDAAAIILMYWASNSLGTELAEHIFKRSANSLHFVDTGDITARKNDIPKLLHVLANNKSILSVNENECNSFADIIKFEALSTIQKEDDLAEEGNIQEYLKKFAKKIRLL